MQVKSVTEVTRHIKRLIDGEQELADLWIRGEVSNLRRVSSGHCYFTLKDAESEIRCVMWRNQVSQLRWLPEQGDQVDAHGYVSVYERGGAYQFYVDALERGGVGDRWREFLELKSRLQAEGLFEEARKRALPKWPRRIGVVTSPTGAAFRDILNVLRARYPLVEVVLSPSPVQGPAAPPLLVAALERLDRLGDVDVVIIARGGGSMEDLWAFNDERVARAVAASRAPVVSGVGHETDFTITDFVADLRAPTPSAAAAAVVPDVAELRSQIEGLVQGLVGLTTARMLHWRELAQGQSHLLRVHDPRRGLAEQRQRIDDLVRRASAGLGNHITLKCTRLTGSEAKLQALNPSLVLERGYAIVQDRESGARIRSVQQVMLGNQLMILVHDGSLGARVTEVSGSTSLPVK